MTRRTERIRWYSIVVRSLRGVFDRDRPTRRASSGPTIIRAVVNSRATHVTSDLSPPPSFLSPSQVEEFYVLTWEAPKEMIFEMPVRNFQPPRPARDPRAPAIARPLSYLEDPLSCRGGLFLDLHGAAPFATIIRDGRLAPFRLDANCGIASGPVSWRKPVPRVHPRARLEASSASRVSARRV